MGKKELVDRCKRGERQAMGLLYTKYVPKLTQVCRKYVKNEDDIHDIIHDSFVVILSSIDKLRDARKLEVWMSTIVRNIALRHLQQPIYEDVSDVEVLEDDEENAFDYEKLITLVEQLPDGYKNVLKLSVLQGLSHKEISELLGIAPHSSSSQLARAKEMVRRNWKRGGAIVIILFVIFLPFLFIEESSQETQVAGIDTESVFLPNEILSQQTDTLLYDVPKQIYIAEVLLNETVFNQSDSVSNQPDSSVVKEIIAISESAQNNSQYILTEERLGHKALPKIKQRSAWHLALTFAGGKKNRLESSVTSAGMGGSISSGNPAPDTIVSNSTHHYMPLTLGFSFGHKLSLRWSVETGLRYSLLRSDFTTETSLSDNSSLPTIVTTKQRLHYIGIPLDITYNLWNSRQFSIYTSVGLAADIPIGSKCRVLWSYHYGAGFQHRISSKVSLYAEPSLIYYFNSGSGTPTIRTERPLEFSIPVGLRFSW